MNFSFCGEAPPSKSVLNRWLVVREYAPTLQIEGMSVADDVITMQKALEQLHAGELVHCGAAGTVFRFLCLRAARLPGTHRLTGSARLLSRPHAELSSILNQLKVPHQWHDSKIEIEGRDWQAEHIKLNTSQTSQFASAILLNSWHLKNPLVLEFEADFVSESYFEMTIELTRSAGMNLERDALNIRVPAGQQVRVTNVKSEADLSSTFALAAIAVVAGSAEFVKFPFESVQPDRKFLDILERMHARLEYTESSVKVYQSPQLRAVEEDLRNCPDLFPVLSVLCACARGRSRLYGAPHLRFKESDRVAKTAELLNLMGVVNEMRPDGLVIEGRVEPRGRLSVVRSFDPDQDHRLAMAAHLAHWAGHPIEILDRAVVAKSFPSFWDLTGAHL